MEKIKLTEKDIETANSYVGLEAKEIFVDECMKQCLAAVDVGLSTEKESDSMPNMFMESTFRKSKYLLTAFVKLYLKQDVETEDGDPWLMTTKAYDEWAGSHVLNQMERMKDKKELRDKCFDILKDYRDIERRLSTAVKGYIAILNDPINRMFQKAYMENSETALEEAKKEIEKLKEEMENRKEKED